MKNFKSFIAGFTCAAVVFSSSAMVFAETGTKTLSAAYNNIKIYVNKQMITPKTVSGAVVEPFIVDGTTYLPVRAVATALDQDVTWDAATNSVHITSKPAPNPTPNPAPNPAPTAEKVLVEKDNVKISFTGIEKKEADKVCKINLKIENKSKKDLDVKVTDLSVNDKKLDTKFSSKVAAGKTEMAAVEISTDKLKELAITEITSFENKFNVMVDKSSDVYFNTDIIKTSVK